MELLNSPWGGSLAFYPAENACRNETVLICPGGGYSFLAPREAEPVAAAFNRGGYHAAILSYQLAAEVHGTGPLKELGWAVRTLRTEEAWRERAEKVWVAGFSAGGHLAASLGALWNREGIFPPEEQEMSRPDGLILGYPVITMGEYGHPRSARRLTGDQKELLELFSLEKQDLSRMPPVFLWGTLEDEKVPVMNSLLLAEKMAKDGASCEYHLFHRGRHGMSLATPEVDSEEEDLHPDAHVAHWMELCLEWLKEQ